MPWVSDYNYVWYEKLAMNIIRAGGHIPNHVAFVMDGNRRYAKSEQLEKMKGHSQGFEKLTQCLRWCLDMGIKEVTAFAFSIENFKRSDEEVKGLFELAREKFKKLLEEKEKLHEHGVCIRVIGNISLLPEDLQGLISRAVLETERNNKLFLNIAISYTSRDEMTRALGTILKHGDTLNVEDISERLIEGCICTRRSPSPDLLFRTSGETRLSDFLMWRLTTTVLYFTNVLWPKITVWEFLVGIFAYQCASIRMTTFKHNHRTRRAQISKITNFYTYRAQNFLEQIESFRRNVFIKLSSLCEL